LSKHLFAECKREDLTGGEIEHRQDLVGAVVIAVSVPIVLDVETQLLAQEADIFMQCARSIVRCAIRSQSAYFRHSASRFR